MSDVMGDVMVLPDGSACFVGSFPLPKDHWIYDPKMDTPPSPLETGEKEKLRARIIEATKYAVRAATMKGKDMDFDPDALIQNMLVGFFGRNPKDCVCVTD